MIYRSDLQQVAIEQHHELIREAGKQRQIRGTKANLTKPVLAKVGRLLINVGEQLEAHSTTNTMKRAYR